MSPATAGAVNNSELNKEFVNSVRRTTPRVNGHGNAQEERTGHDDAGRQEQSTHRRKQRYIVESNT